MCVQTNLKESNDELVQHVSSLQHEVNAVRDATTRLTKDKVSVSFVID
jgi:FtsZ-binding cell division protein ZapB